MKDSAHEHLSLLLKINEVLSSSLSRQEVMQDLIRRVIESLGAERGFIVLRKHHDWEVLATHYVDPARVVADRYFSRTIVSSVAQSGQPRLCVDALKSDNTRSIVVQGIRSILCAPLRWSGKVQGVVYADNSLKAGQFNETHLAIFTAIASQASRNLENHALQQELRRAHWQTLETLDGKNDPLSAEGQAGTETINFALRVLEGEAPSFSPLLESKPHKGLTLCLFGPFQGRLEGELITDWSTRKNRELLAYLAAHRGQVVHEEKLMDLFWSQGGEKGLHSLHNGITKLRKILGGRDCIERKLDGYCLNPSIWVDVEQFVSEFKAGSAAARRGQWDQAISHLGRAEALAQSEFMEGCYSDWTYPVRGRLEDQLQECRELLASHFAQHGKHQVAVALWKRVLEHDRCHEQAYRGLLEAYRSLGRRSESVRAYQACEKAFKEELELPPPEGLKALLEF